MRIVQINAVYGTGSTGTIVADIHEMALARGIESHVAYSVAPIPASAIRNGYRIGRTPGKKMHALLARISGKQAYFSRLATAGLLRYFDRIQPDVVHLHNLHNNYLNLNRLLGYLARERIPVVLTLHDCWFYTGGCFHYTAAGCDAYLRNCGSCPKRWEEFPAYFADRSGQILSDRKRYFSGIRDLTVAGVSRWVTGEAQKTFLAGADFRTLYNGVDTALFHPVKSDFKKLHGIEDSFAVLGMANKWMQEVNRGTLETVLAGLPEDAVLVIAGCTEAQLRRLPRGVIGVKYLGDRRQLCELYSGCDVFANCTREDTLSMVNLEVQACGTPIVTYRNTGAAETVDGLHSFSVETGDASALLAEILRVKSVGKAVYAEGCRAWVNANFEKNRNYQRYLALYEEVYRGRGRTE